MVLGWTSEMCRLRSAQAPQLYPNFQHLGGAAHRITRAPLQSITLELPRGAVRPAAAQGQSAGSRGMRALATAGKPTISKSPVREGELSSHVLQPQRICLCWKGDLVVLGTRDVVEQPSRLSL